MLIYKKKLFVKGYSVITILYNNNIAKIKIRINCYKKNKKSHGGG